MEKKKGKRERMESKLTYFWQYLPSYTKWQKGKYEGNQDTKMQ